MRLWQSHTIRVCPARILHANGGPVKAPLLMVEVVKQTFFVGHAIEVSYEILVSLDLAKFLYCPSHEQGEISNNLLFFLIEGYRGIQVGVPPFIYAEVKGLYT